MCSDVGVETNRRSALCHTHSGLCTGGTASGTSSRIHIISLIELLSTPLNLQDAARPSLRQKPTKVTIHYSVLERASSLTILIFLSCQFPGWESLPFREEEIRIIICVEDTSVKTDLVLCFRTYVMFYKLKVNFLHLFREVTEPFVRPSQWTLHVDQGGTRLSCPINGSNAGIQLIFSEIICLYYNWRRIAEHNDGDVRTTNNGFYWLTKLH